MAAARYFASDYGCDDVAWDSVEGLLCDLCARQLEERGGVEEKGRPLYSDDLTERIHEAVAEGTDPVTECEDCGAEVIYAL